jgi:hypothetical protein
MKKKLQSLIDFEEKPDVIIFGNNLSKIIIIIS